ncbi:MAG TPA: hypothetical protein VF303_00755 [Candidatus Nanoarchaeia archaeon]
MGILKSKVFILVFVVLILLVVAAVAGYYLFSIYTFNTFTKTLDSENKSLFIAFDQEVATTNKIQQNLIKSVEFETDFDKETNAKYLNAAKSDYEKSLNDYKKGIDELKSDSSDLVKFKDLPLWLTADQKKFTNDLTTSIGQYLEARKADYQFQVKIKPINNSIFQMIEDMLVIVEYPIVVEKNLATALTPAQVQQAFSKDFYMVESLEKYTKPDYKFEGHDKLAGEFPKSYKAFGAVKESYGAIYLMYKALANGNYSQFEQATATLSQSDDLESVLGDLDIELAQKNKPHVAKIKDSYVNYAKALDFFAEKKLSSNLLSKEKVLVQNNQNKVIVFAYLVELYYADEYKYPTDTSFHSFIATLKAGNHFDENLKFDESDFTYASDGTHYYEMAYKDDATGKQDMVLVGVKETADKTLGAWVLTPVIKVDNKKFKLEFVNSLTNSINSLLPLGSL